MHTIPRFLCLSSASRQALARQVAQNGAFQHEMYDAATSEVLATARLAIEQCSDGMTARIELGDSVNSITLAKRDDNAARLAVFIESLANDLELPVGIIEVEEHLLVSELESTLRDAVRERRGTYYLPVEGVEELALLIRQSATDPKRVAFRFELDGACLTLPVLLPTDRSLAYALLNLCVQELIANYRTAA
jgi:lipoprotein NlpI